MLRSWKAPLVLAAALVCGWLLSPLLETVGAPRAVKPLGTSHPEPPEDSAGLAPPAPETPRATAAAQPTRPGVSPQIAPDHLETPPPGTLEVLVYTAGDLPEAGWIHLAPGAEWLPADLARASDERESRPLDTAGRAQFEGLAAGPYRVGLEVRRDLVFQRSVTLRADQGTIVTLTLDTASIVGRVHDEEGRAVPNARIQVSPKSNRFSVVQWTDASGEYAVDHLFPGPHWVSLSVAEEETTRTVPLARFETKRVDFGRASALPDWTGSVRNRAGQPLGSVELAIEGNLDQSYRKATITPNGTFRIPLEPGSYRVSAKTPSNDEGGHSVLIEELLVPEGGLTQNVLWPGTRVEGRVVHGDGRNYRGTSGSLTVYLHKQGHDWPGAFTRVPVDAKGDFTIDGLEPGTWLLSSHPLAPMSPVSIDVLDGDIEVTARIVLP